MHAMLCFGSLCQTVCSGSNCTASKRSARLATARGKAQCAMACIHGPCMRKHRLATQCDLPALLRQEFGVSRAVMFFVLVASGWQACTWALGAMESCLCQLLLLCVCDGARLSKPPHLRVLLVPTERTGSSRRSSAERCVLHPAVMLGAPRLGFGVSKDALARCRGDASSGNGWHGCKGGCGAGMALSVGQGKHS